MPFRMTARLVAALAAVSTLALACTATAHDGVAQSGGMLQNPVIRSAFGSGALRASAAFQASAVPSGFAETTVWSGLTDPVAVRFAPDGRVFVLEQGGVIKQFDSIDDPTATVWADLSAKVHQLWDRGALGMALDPQFTSGRPYIYLLYAYDAPIGGTAPTWGDACPTPPGPTADGCVVSGRLSKVSQGGAEQVLINDWCQQYPSHSVGTVAFGPDGALYAGAGEGASFDFLDYGAAGNPVNPCGDPPGGVGGSMSPPTAEGGALRSQDIRTGGDPASLDGAIIRVDPDTGAALADNPNAGSSDPNTRRIIAHGLRNPFRWAFKPGTSDIYLGDVGAGTWEEIDKLPTGGAVENFGWPCYEGTPRQGGFDAANLNICENLYAAGASAVTPPLYAYSHASKVKDESCPTGTSSISGVAFYTGSTFPSRYSGAMFFADYSRNCMWVMFPGAGGTPDPATRETFYPGADGPVDVQVGPDGALWWVSLNSDSVRKLQVLNPNNAPTARASATPTSGSAPLTVAFDGSGSSDPDGGALTYAWDLDGDGAYDDSTAQKPSFTYASRGQYTVRLRVTDPGGASGTDTLTIKVGIPPTATMDTPVAGTTWRVDEVIGFSGRAVDGAGAAIPASGLSWKLIMHHCSALAPSSCHEHQIRTFTGASGSFAAPDHEYPSYLELELTATDGSLSSTVSRRLDPKTVDLTLQSDPAGASIAVGSEAQAAPFTRTVIRGSTVSLIADSPQIVGSDVYDFASWSDGGALAHTITAPATATTYTARFTQAPCSQAGLVGAWGFEESGGAIAADSSGAGNAGTIAGATRTSAGRYGSALSFSGDDVVNVPDSASLDVATAATVSAWVYPTDLGTAWRTAVFKAQSGQLAYALYAHTDKGSPNGELFMNGGGEQVVDAAAPLPLNQWSYLTMTWDGTTQRLYVGTTEVAQRATSGTLVDGSGPLSFGGNGVWSEWFAGKLDDIRVYNRALTASEVAADMADPVACAAGPPPQPVLSVSKGGLSFTATQGGADPAAQTVDVANTGTGTLDWTATESSPWLAVGPASGSAPAALTVTPSIGGLAPGTYTTAVTIASAGATGSPKTVDVALRVDPPPQVDPPPPPVDPPPPAAAGPVGAWGFDEPTGATARDASGSGNPGTLSGPARVTAGRFGPGLSFDGVNDFVSIADDPSLDLTTAATLEAWVYPTALGDRWRTVLFKERPARLSYGLYAHAGAARPRGYLFPAGRGEQAVAGPAALPVKRWSHLAMTWDGTTQRLFLDGDQVAARAQGGTLAGGSRPLRIGGNTIWSEWFRGRIDEVRVYDRALTRSELAGDMSTPVSGTGAAPAVRALEQAQARARRSYGSRRARLRAVRRARRAGYRDAAKLRTRREWAAMRARRLAIR